MKEKTQNTQNEQHTMPSKDEQNAVPAMDEQHTKGTPSPQNANEALFTTMPVAQALRTLAVPTVISQLINLIYNMADAYFIGFTGDSYKIAGVTLAFSLFMLTIPISNVFGTGGGSLIARLMGRGQTDKSRSVSAYSFYGAIVAALAYSLLIAVFMDPLLAVLGASPETLPYAEQYTIFVVILGSLPIILSQTLAMLLRNVGEAKIASYGLSGGGVLNMILDPLFMFVLLPPGMEVLGAALATFLSNVASCLFLLVQYLRQGKTSPLSANVHEMLHLSTAHKRELYSVGLPSGILPGLFDLANVFMNALMAAHGDMSLAAMGIVMKAERLPNAINIGICQGMLPLVAYSFSARDHDRMERVIHLSRRVGLFIAGVSLVLFLVFANPLSSLFLNTSGENAAVAMQTVALAGVFLRLRALASPFQLLNYHSSFCLQAMGDGRDSLLHAVVREIGLYIPFMFLLDHLFGQYGLAGALALGELGGALFATYLLRRWLAHHSVDA